MRQRKHHAIISDEVINELVNNNIIKMNKDGRVESLSFIANQALKNMLSKKGGIW
jgi:hypothetical protein